jgi:preprotein translocase subunit Sss1
MKPDLDEYERQAAKEERAGIAIVGMIVLSAMIAVIVGLILVLLLTH